MSSARNNSIPQAGTQKGESCNSEETTVFKEFCPTDSGGGWGNQARSCIFARSARPERTPPAGKETIGTPKRRVTPVTLDPKRVKMTSSPKDIQSKNRDDRKSTSSTEKDVEPTNEDNVNGESILRSFEIEDHRGNLAKVRQVWLLAGKMVQHIAQLASETNDCRRLNPEIRESIGVVAAYGERLEASLSLLDVEAELSEADLAAKDEGKNEETEIRNLLDRGDLNEEQTSELLLRKWPAPTFRATTVKRKSLCTSESEYRVLICKVFDAKDPIHRNLEGQLPGIAEAIAEEQGVISLENTCTVRASDGTRTTRTRRVIAYREPDTEDKGARAQNCIEKAREIVELTGGTNADIGVPENGTYMWRKAFEIAMAGQPGEVTLCVKKRANKEDGRPKRKQTRPARTTELVVRQEGETFASIVGRLKEAAGTFQAPITRVTNGGDGTVRVKLAGSQTGREDTTRAIARAVPGAAVSSGRSKAVRLGQLLAGTTEEEVVTGIQEALGHNTHARIVAMRRSYGDTIRATVILPEINADALIRTGRVRVGIIATHPIAPPMRCRRCWGIGHMAAGCKGPDRSSLCFRCHKGGHKAADCRDQKPEDAAVPPAEL